MNECENCNVSMEQGYTIINNNLHGGFKIAKQQSGFEKLENKIYAEICRKCGQIKLYSKDRS